MANTLQAPQWENVWGSYNKIVPRDGEAIRRMATMLRFLGGEYGFFANVNWIPRVPVVQGHVVFASQFPLSESGGGDAVWTFINRDRERDVSQNTATQHPTSCSPCGACRGVG